VYLCYSRLPLESDVATNVGEEWGVHAGGSDCDRMYSYIGGAMGVYGGMRERHTLAKSFASWPPWLMMGCRCRVAGG
jgi:hypothetical protein